MILGFLFPIGGGFKDLEKSKQKNRFKKYDLKYYSSDFDKVNIFTYINEKEPLFKNCNLYANKKIFNRFLYAILMPFIYQNEFKKTDIFRASHLTATIPAIIAKIIYKKPFVFNYGYDYSKFSKIEKKLIRAYLLTLWTKLAAKFADGIIYANAKIEIKIRKFSKKVILIPNGVDTHQFNFKVKKPDEGFTVLYIGRLEKQKNLESLILAIGLIENKNIKTIFVGEGSLESKLIELAHRNKVNLKILKSIPNEKLPDIYHRADLFALVSYAEGHPKVMLEAQSCGTPVLASVNFAKDLIKDKKTGILCNSKTSDISRKIKFVIDSKQLKSDIAKNARKEIEKNYSIDNLMEKEIKFIKSTYAKST